MISIAKYIVLLIITIIINFWIIFSLSKENVELDRLLTHKQERYDRLLVEYKTVLNERNVLLKTMDK